MLWARPLQPCPLEASLLLLPARCLGCPSASAKAVSPDFTMDTAISCRLLLYLLKIYLVRLRKFPVSSSSDARSFETRMRVSFTAFSLSSKIIVGSTLVNVQPSSRFQIKPRRVNTAYLVGLLVGGVELRAAVAATQRDCTGGRARGAHHAAVLPAPGRPWCPAPCSLRLTQREWPVQAEVHGPASAVTRCPQLMFGHF